MWPPSSSSFLFASRHHHHRVPAAVRADALLQRGVARRALLHVRRDGVDVGRVRRVRDVGARACAPSRSASRAGNARAPGPRARAPPRARRATPGFRANRGRWRRDVGERRTWLSSSSWLSICGVGPSYYATHDRPIHRRKIARRRRCAPALKPAVAALAARGARPGLAAILAGDDPASRVYVRNKVRACEEVGVRSRAARVPADVPEAELLECIAELNARPGGARHPGAAAAARAPRRRARARGGRRRRRTSTASTPRTSARCSRGTPRFVPCTPAGVMRLLEHAGVPLAGRHAVVIGRSTIVGKPLALLLLQKDATVTICHSKTTRSGRAHAPGRRAGRRDRPAAKLVSAADGQARRLRHRRRHQPHWPTASSPATWISPRSSEVAGWITPVPGGVGPMTIAMLVANTVRATELCTCNNPLLDFSGLPRFAELKPAHVTPADRHAARARRARRSRAPRRRPPTWDEFVTPLEDANERLGRAWGQVAHLHAVLDSPELREAYNANLPKVTQYWTELGQNQALFEKYARCAPRRSSPALAPRASASSRTRCATSASAAPSCRRTRSRATPQIQEELPRLSAKFSENLLDATNAFSHRDRGREAPRRHSGGRAAGRARSGGEGRQGGLEVHAAHALLPAGDAVRRGPRAARDDVPRERHARLRVRQAGVGQHAADRAHPPAAPRDGARCSATPATPRCRWCRRWPSRPRRCSASSSDLARARAALRRARPRRAARVRARRARPAPSWKPGTSPTPRKSCARSATRSPTRR